MIRHVLGAATMTAALLVLPAHAASAAEPAAGRTTVTFSDTHEILHGNPYTGTAFDVNTHRTPGTPGYTFTNDPGITDFIEGTKKIPADADVVRLQIAWADFEPDDGVFVWDRLDAFMKRVNEQGKTVEFQLLMSEAPDIVNDPGVFPYEYPPAWLFDKAGVPFRMAQYNSGYYSKQPLYYNPIYLDRLKRAVDAFAGRYDGDPGVAWVDLRAFSLFGEWSGWNDAMNFPWPDNATRVSTLQAILKIYDDAFDKSMVMMQNAGAEVNKNDPDADTQAKRFSVYGYGKAATFENWGVRSDTVNAGFVWHNYGDTAQAPYVNRRLRRDMIQVSEGSNWDNPTIMLNNPRLFVKNSLEGYHSNLQGINNTGFENWQPMKDAYGEWFETLARYTGYRFLMPTATYDTEVKPGGEFRISHTWTNNAVGFSPRRYPVEVRFTDRSTGDVVWRDTDATLDQTKLFKGDVRQINSAFTLPADLPAGSYDVAVAMLGEDGKPRIELAMPGGKDKVYPIGTVQVAAGAAQAGRPTTPLTQFTIQNEDYTAAGGAYGVETPPEGGLGALYMDAAGESAEYDNVDVPATGTYRVEFRASSEEANHLKFEVDGKEVATIKVPDSGGYNTYRTFERQIPLTEGRHTIKLTRPDGRWFFLNWMRFTLERPESITLQAESATEQQGTQNTDLTDSDDGTPGVAYIDTGDWSRFDDVSVPADGKYLLQLRYSTVNDKPLKFRVEVDGADATGPLSLRPTSGMLSPRTEDFVLPLTAGKHSVKVVWIEASTSIVWNWMRLDLQGTSEQTIEAEHWTMQWNTDQEWNWKGPDTGVVTKDGIVGGIDPNDYLRYENVFVPNTGMYKVTFKGSAAEDTTFRFEVDGDRNTLFAPKSDDANVTTWVKIPAGLHTLRVVSEGSGLALDKFTLTASTAAIKALDVTGAGALKVGEPGRLSVATVGADGTRTPVTKGVTFKSSDPSIATVDADGLVTARTWGTATITAIHDGFSGEHKITVTDPKVVLTYVNDTDKRIAYPDDDFIYSPDRGMGDYNDDVHAGWHAGQAVEFTFTGTGISLLSERYSDMSTIDIYVDGELKATVDCDSPVRLTAQRVFQLTGLPMGDHTIKVVNGADKFVIIDAFVVETPNTWNGAELGVGNVNAKSVTLTWPSVPTATGYAVFNGGTEVMRVTGTTARVTGLRGRTSYTFTVRPLAADGTTLPIELSATVQTKG
ncbi:carbohydrate-binding protein [Streptosporangium sp. NPDC003464]